MSITGERTIDAEPESSLPTEKKMKPISSPINKTISMIKLYRNWPVALFDRVHGIARRPISYKLRNGVTLLAMAGSRDVRVINEVWIDQIYTPTAWGQIRPNWTVLDLGAHRGIFAVFAARLAGRVYSVEANNQALGMCRVNTALNRLNGTVTLIHGAIAANAGKTAFYVAFDAGSSSVFPDHSSNIEREVIVQKIPISRLMQEIGHVDLLKMDVEGTEYELLLDESSREWLMSVDRIAMEYHSVRGAPYSVDDLCASLTEAGFQVRDWPERKILHAARPSRFEV